MSHVRRLLLLSAFALLVTFGQTSASAEELKTVFVIAMENHNWTQPANQFTGGIQQIFQNPAAPFINSLVNGTAVANINGRDARISEQVAFATNYHNVLATPSGNNPHIHPQNRTICGRKPAPTLGFSMTMIRSPRLTRRTRTRRGIWQLC